MQGHNLSYQALCHQAFHYFYFFALSEFSSRVFFFFFFFAGTDCSVILLHMTPFFYIVLNNWL
jgi:hypothetical protein